MNWRGAPRPSGDALVVLALKVAASAGIWGSGFRAVSDDDYARVVLAQRFAEAPALDPTGTSWLPFPFWIYGAAQSVFGASLGVARATAALLGLFSAMLVWWGARVVGLGRLSALVGAGIAAVFPYSARLGVATVPEAPSAALTLFGAATLASGPRLRALGAGALFVACGSRYEPWAVAFVFASFTLRDALRTRDRALFGCAALALTFPALWLLHGAVRHADPLFFVQRVTAYRAALGPEEALLVRLLRTPLSWFAEPELVSVSLLAGLWLASRSRLQGCALRRFIVALLGIPCFLILGDVRGSAPTHHGERALLALWFGSALLIGLGCESVARDTKRGTRLKLALGMAGCFALGALLRAAHPLQPFQARRSEVDIGLRARERRLPGLAIDAPDFGYFAVQAAFGSPSATLALNLHDPRSRPVEPSRMSPETLRRTLASKAIRWLALPASRAPLAHALGDVRERNSDWLLLELN